MGGTPEKERRGEERREGRSRGGKNQGDEGKQKGEGEIVDGSRGEKNERRKKRGVVICYRALTSDKSDCQFHKFDSL